MEKERKINVNFLRTLLKQNPNPSIDKNSVTIGQQSFALHTPTNFHNSNDSSQFYSVGEVVHFHSVHNPAMSHAQYIASARQLGLGYVRVEDKEELYSFLSFANGTSSYISSDQKTAEEFVEETKKCVPVSLVFLDPFSSSVGTPPRTFPGLEDSTVQNLFLKLFAFKGTKRPATLGKTNPLAPILVVPALPSVPLNLKTATAVLVEGRFPSESRLGEFAQRNKEPPTKIRKKSKLKEGSFVFFSLRSSMQHMRKEELERVACVFAVGESWQFTGWPISESEVLQNHLVVCVVYKNDSERKKWCEERGVLVFEIECENRNNDAKVYHELWEKIYSRIRKKGDKKLAY